MSEEMHIDIIYCARCRGNHPSLLFMPFGVKPITVDDHTFLYWAMCPTVEEPILLESVITGE